MQPDNALKATVNIIKKSHNKHVMFILITTVNLLGNEELLATYLTFVHQAPFSYIRFFILNHRKYQNFIIKASCHYEIRN